MQTQQLYYFQTWWECCPATVPDVDDTKSSQKSKQDIAQPDIQQTCWKQLKAVIKVKNQMVNKKRKPQKLEQ